MPASSSRVRESAWHAAPGRNRTHGGIVRRGLGRFPAVRSLDHSGLEPGSVRGHRKRLVSDQRKPMLRSSVLWYDFYFGCPRGARTRLQPRLVSLMTVGKPLRRLRVFNETQNERSCREPLSWRFGMGGRKQQ